MIRIRYKPETDAYDSRNVAAINKATSPQMPTFNVRSPVNVSKNSRVMSPGIKWDQMNQTPE